MTKEMLAEGLMTMREVAGFFKCGLTRAYELTNEGGLPYLQQGRKRLVPKAAVLEYAARLLAETERRREEEC